MDEKSMKEQEAKAFDEKLASDCICSLHKKVDDLLKFIALQSMNCSESECRKKAIDGMGHRGYLSFLIREGKLDALDDEKWNCIFELINKETER